MSIKIGDTLIVINNQPLKGNDKAPPIKNDEELVLKGIYFDSKGNPHYNVGLISQLEYVSSYETGEHLPGGNQIHWCHPSRFRKKE